MRDQCGLRGTAIPVLPAGVGLRFVYGYGLPNARRGIGTSAGQPNGHYEFARDADANGWEHAATRLSRSLAIREKLRNGASC